MFISPKAPFSKDSNNSAPKTFKAHNNSLNVNFCKEVLVPTIEIRVRSKMLTENLTLRVLFSIRTY